MSQELLRRERVIVSSSFSPPRLQTQTCSHYMTCGSATCFTFNLSVCTTASLRRGRCCFLFELFCFFSCIFFLPFEARIGFCRQAMPNQYGRGSPSELFSTVNAQVPEKHAKPFIAQHHPHPQASAQVTATPVTRIAFGNCCKAYVHVLQHLVIRSKSSSWHYCRD